MNLWSGLSNPLAVTKNQRYSVTLASWRAVADPANAGGDTALNGFRSP